MNTMRFPFLRRLLMAAATGFIFLYYSELMFWSKYDPVGMAPSRLGLTLLAYTIMAYLFLCLLSRFRARSVWALFLVGATFGWICEGVLVTTMYDDFPYQLSWTGLAWHDLITVMTGWYGVRRMLGQNRMRHLLALAVAIGIFYGLWAVFWWREENHRTPIFDFAVYVMGSSGFLIFSYWLYDYVKIVPFHSSSWEVGILSGLVLVYYFFGTLSIQPMSIYILPPLMAWVGMVLWRNRAVETGGSLLSSDTDPVPFQHYLSLLAIPVAAIFTYAFCYRMNLSLPTNLIVYWITTPLGFLMLALGSLMILRARPKPTPRRQFPFGDSSIVRK